MRIDSLITIIGMALASYLARAGGLWLMGRMSMTPQVQRWLRHIPGAILVAIIAPAALTNGPAEALATLAVIITMVRKGNLLFAMAIGVGAVWTLRHFLS